MLFNYRPLAEQRRRHGLLSRLDVEYISSSQVFQMLSGERQRCSAYCTICMLPAVGGGVLSTIRPSVPAVDYRHAGCLQLSHVWTADPSVDERKSAVSGTAIGGGIASCRP